MIALANSFNSTVIEICEDMFEYHMNLGAIKCWHLWPFFKTALVGKSFFAKASMDPTANSATDVELAYGVITNGRKWRVIYADPNSAIHLFPSM